MRRFLLDSTRDPLKALSGAEITLALQCDADARENDDSASQRLGIDSVPPSPTSAISSESSPTSSHPPSLFGSSTGSRPTSVATTIPTQSLSSFSPSTGGGPSVSTKPRTTSLRLGSVINEGGWGIVYRAQEIPNPNAQRRPSLARMSSTSSFLSSSRRASAPAIVLQPPTPGVETDSPNADEAGRRRSLPELSDAAPTSTSAKLRSLLVRSFFPGASAPKKRQFAVKVLKRAPVDTRNSASLREREMQDTELRNHLRASRSGHEGIVRLWGVLCEGETDLGDITEDFDDSERDPSGVSVPNKSQDVDVEVKEVENDDDMPSNEKSKQTKTGKVISTLPTSKHTHEGKMFFVMDYCRGGDLYEAIERRRYYNNVPALSSIFLQLLDAVEYLHNMGIYHRDLKPENVLLVNKYEDGVEPRVSIADFGLSSTNPNSVEKSGSSQYMSPESCGRYGGVKYKSLVLPSPDPRSPLLIPFPVAATDVWSLGIILLSLALPRLLPWPEAIEGSYVGAAQNFRDYTQDTGRWFMRKFDVSEDFNHVLTGMLDLNPWERSSIETARRRFRRISPDWMVNPPKKTPLFGHTNLGKGKDRLDAPALDVPTSSGSLYSLYANAPPFSAFYQPVPKWIVDQETTRMSLSSGRFTDENIAFVRRERELDLMEGRYVPPGYTAPPRRPRYTAARLRLSIPNLAPSILPPHLRDPPSPVLESEVAPVRVVPPGPAPTSPHLAAPVARRPSEASFVDKTEEELQQILNAAASKDGIEGDGTGSSPSSKSKPLITSELASEEIEDASFEPSEAMERNETLGVASIHSDQKTSSSSPMSSRIPLPHRVDEVPPTPPKPLPISAPTEMAGPFGLASPGDACLSIPGLMPDSASEEESETSISPSASSGIASSIAGPVLPDEERRRSFPEVGPQGEIVYSEQTGCYQSSTYPPLESKILTPPTSGNVHNRLPVA